MCDRYDHTQHGPLFWTLLLPAAALLAMAIAFAHIRPVVLVALPLTAVLLIAAAAFGRLRVYDDGEALLLEYGPLPMVRKRIAYSDMTAVRPARSKIIDGWGVHWVIGRGWTYNLWGRDCVEVDMGKRLMRIGTDDVDGLLSALQTKLEGTRREI